jgi:agmatine deiminase
MKQAAVRAPAEWEPHARCLMSWPCQKHDLWEGERFKPAREEYAAVAKAIAQFEPVLMVADPGSGEDAKRQCGSDVDVVEFPIDDSWTRDNGPIFVLEDGKRVVGRNFRFNAWGEKFFSWDKDDAIPALLCDYLKVECRPVDMILEGGSILTDGQGTLVTTRQCLLHPSRNPDMSQSEIEAKLKESLGVRKIIWLPWGLDWGTDGHVDCVVSYLAPGKVLAQTAPPGTQEDKWLKKNLAVLEAATDAEGRKLQVLKTPPIMPEIPRPAQDGDDELVAFPYANLYHANGGAVVPLAGVPDSDEQVMARLREIITDRKVVGVPIPTVHWGGGGIHCITQQMPAAPS